jgi:hypothetical protein
MSKLASYGAMNDAMGLVKVIVVSHPKKAGRAEIVIKFPKDGAGRLRAWCADFFTVPSAGVQYASAGGYGYDKQTACLSNFTIDGHKVGNHCDTDAISSKFLKAYRKHHAAADAVRLANVERACKSAGYYFSNWGADGWGSCYKLSGLGYLRALGYQVVSIG